MKIKFFVRFAFIFSLHCILGMLALADTNTLKLPTNGQHSLAVEAECAPTSVSSSRCFEAGVKAFKKKDDKEAYASFYRACELGSAVGCYYLGQMQYYGLGTARSEKLAENSLMLACNKNLGEACADVVLKLGGSKEWRATPNEKVIDSARQLCITGDARACFYYGALFATIPCAFDGHEFSCYLNPTSISSDLASRASKPFPDTNCLFSAKRRTVFGTSEVTCVRNKSLSINGIKVHFNPFELTRLSAMEGKFGLLGSDVLAQVPLIAEFDPTKTLFKVVLDQSLAADNANGELFNFQNSYYSDSKTFGLEVKFPTQQGKAAVLNAHINFIAISLIDLSFVRANPESFEYVRSETAKDVYGREGKIKLYRYKVFKPIQIGGHKIRINQIYAADFNSIKQDTRPSVDMYLGLDILALAKWKFDFLHQRFQIEGL